MRFYFYSLYYKKNSDKIKSCRSIYIKLKYQSFILFALFTFLICLRELHNPSTSITS